jgi:hypothetical protein
MVEVRSTNQIGVGEGAYVYGITNAGIERAREALERSQYAGPAPVPLQAYCDAMRNQSRKDIHITARTMRQVLSQLVLSEKHFTSWVRPSIRALRYSCMGRLETARPAWRAPLAS